MGLFKIIGLVSGLPIRPTTGRERARRYQRQANNLLEEQLYAIQNLAQPQQVIQAPSDSRPRGTCPACMEMMLVGASTCPHCHTSGITWPGTTGQTSSDTQPTDNLTPYMRQVACPKCKQGIQPTDTVCGWCHSVIKK